MFIFHNLFYAKHISQSHILMVWVLSALANGNYLGFLYYSKL